MRIKKRHSLVLALVAGELACLLVGGVAFCEWLRSSLSDLSEYQVLQDNALIAGQIAKLIESMELRDTTVGSRDWQRLQRAVEDIRLPNDGFVCVTRNPTGALICHPDLRRRPEMANMTPGQASLDTGRTTQSIVELMQSRGAASGAVEMPDGLHLIAARHIPDLDVNVMVHQRYSGIQGSLARIMQPVYVIGLVVSGAIALFTTLVSLQIILRYENRLAIANEQLEATVRRRTQALMKTRNATIFGLARLAESRDTDTGDHLERIRDYAVLLAESLAHQNPNIDRAFIDDLALASSLHDIGKVGISDAVLLKPGRLTAEERRLVEQHSVIGGDCLAEIEQRLGDDDFLEMAREIAYFHHERWDGAGYPHGLRADDIPLPARIVAVADVYDALTSKRPYKEAWDHQAAYDLIVAGSGSQFDPEVVAAFICQEREFAVLCQHCRQAQPANSAPELVEQLV